MKGKLTGCLNWVWASVWASIVGCIIGIYIGVSMIDHPGGYVEAIKHMLLMCFIFGVLGGVLGGIFGGWLSLLKGVNISKIGLELNFRDKDKELKELKELRDFSLITEEEYQYKKDRLMDS